MTRPRLNWAEERARALSISSGGTRSGRMAWMGGNPKVKAVPATAAMAMITGR